MFLVKNSFIQIFIIQFAFPFLIICCPIALNLVPHDLLHTLAWFSYGGKIPEDEGFYYFPTVKWQFV